MKNKLIKYAILLFIPLVTLYGLFNIFYIFVNQQHLTKLFTKTAVSITESLQNSLPQKMLSRERIMLETELKKYLSESIVQIRLIDITAKLLITTKKFNDYEEKKILEKKLQHDTFYKQKIIKSRKIGNYLEYITPIQVPTNNKHSLGKELGLLNIIFKNPFWLITISPFYHLLIISILFFITLLISLIIYKFPRKISWSPMVLYLQTLTAEANKNELESTQKMLNIKTNIEEFEIAFQELLEIFCNLAEQLELLKNNYDIQEPRLDIKRLDAITTGFIELKNTSEKMALLQGEITSILSGTDVHFKKVITLGNESKKASVNLALSCAQIDNNDSLILYSEEIRHKTELLVQRSTELALNIQKTLKNIGELNFKKSGASLHTYPDADQTKHFWNNQKLNLEKANCKLSETIILTKQQIEKATELNKLVSVKARSSLNSLHKIKQIIQGDSE